MASWTVPVVVVISLVVICGSSDSSTQGDGFIHGHPLSNGAGARGIYFSGIDHNGQNPLLSGSGIRGFHLPRSGYPGYYGYNNEESNYGDNAENYNEENSHKDGGYNPKAHTGYDYSPYRQEPGYKVYDKIPEYYHNQAYPYYPDYFQNGYPAYHPLPHPKYPSAYGFGHYKHTASAETGDSSEEVDSVLKVIDEREIYVHQPQDKVLYIPRPQEEIEKEEKEMEKEKEEEQESSSQESEESESKLEEETKLVKKTEKKEEDVKEDTHDEYSDYLSGYSATAPIALDNTFCEGLADGNFANPGLTKDADPRCTYITCAGYRPIIFNCAPGTYNGHHIDYHTPVWASSSPDYKGAPHHRFEVHGRDFCGQRDIGTFTRGPVCSGRRSQKPVAKKEDPSPNSVLSEDTSVETKDDEVVYKRPEAKFAVLRPIEMNDMHKMDIDNVIAYEDSDMGKSNEINEDDKTNVEKVEDKETGVMESEETIDDEKVNENESVDKVDGSESVEIQYDEGPEPIPEQELEVEDLTLNQDIKSSSYSEYSNYNRGYGKAPIVLHTDFCANMEDGNYANPGLTRDVDPRCTYITCSSKRGYIFNCPLGTFNGADYKHHHPIFGRDITSYTGAYHYRYRDSEFCGVNDYTLVCTP